jgi:hypothetical protein
MKKSRFADDSAVNRSKIELAVLNNTCWYEAIFTAHGLANETDGRVWRSHETAPPFHSNLVVLSPLTTRSDIETCAAGIEQQPRPKGWSLKDSYACLDLTPLGYAVLFDADWIWRDPVAVQAPACDAPLSWKRLDSPSSLAEWERAWSGDTRNEKEVLRTRQFPDRLLGSADHMFFAGRLDGKVVAGGIANRSPGAVGLSNIFSPPEFLEDTWRALTCAISAAFPGTPIVGYERGVDLELAQGVGFAPVGKLRVWCRPS